MASPRDRFTRLQRVAIFLIALGEEKAREILADMNLETLEQVNTAIASLGSISPEEKAAVMLEFSDFFFKDKPLTQKTQKRKKRKKPAAAKKSQPQATASADQKSQPPLAQKGEKSPPVAQNDEKSPAPPQDDEKAILATLQKLRERVDPNKIDWSRAGYDFGEGFKGPQQDRR